LKQYFIAEAFPLSRLACIPFIYGIFGDTLCNWNCQRLNDGTGKCSEDKCYCSGQLEK
jgi:hypothetical protein